MLNINIPKNKSILNNSDIYQTFFSVEILFSYMIDRFSKISNSKWMTIMVDF